MPDVQGSSRGVISRSYTHMSLSVIFIVACTFLAYYVAATDRINLFLVVFLSGTVGGVANNYRRLLHLPLNVQTEIPRYTSRQIILQLYTSPLVGGIFAIILYALFASGILQGALFPVFSEQADFPIESLSEFFEYAMALKPRDVGKLLFWTFVAGFSEGFVPNIIDKMAREVADQKS